MTPPWLAGTPPVAIRPPVVLPLCPAAEVLPPVAETLPPLLLEPASSLDDSHATAGANSAAPRVNQCIVPRGRRGDIPPNIISARRFG
jgi:hypothetical protein